MAADGSRLELFLLLLVAEAFAEVMPVRHRFLLVPAKGKAGEVVLGRRVLGHAPKIKTIIYKQNKIELSE
jgi:hypothetical protein